MAARPVTRSKRRSGVVPRTLRLQRWPMRSHSVDGRGAPTYGCTAASACTRRGVTSDVLLLELVASASLAASDGGDQPPWGSARSKSAACLPSLPRCLLGPRNISATCCCMSNIETMPPGVGWSG